MIELWIPLNDVPAEGREFHFTDQSLWTGPLKEFGLAASIGQEFAAQMFVTPQDGGVLVSGSFSGSVLLPCDRCIEEFELTVAGEFDSFEEPCDPASEVPEECRVRRTTKGELEFDAAGYLWEQFMLALPVSPVCAEDCQGLCPDCGVNRSKTACACVKDKGDPRLAVLRNLKLS